MEASLTANHCRFGVLAQFFLGDAYESENAQQAIRFLQKEADPEQCGEGERQVEVAPFDAGDEEDDHSGRQQDGSRAEVAEADQADQATQDERGGPQCVAIVDLQFPARYQPGQKDDQHRLGDFGGLKLHARQTVPAVRIAVDEEHADEQQCGHAERNEYPQRMGEPGIVESLEDEQQAEADRGEDHLFDGETPGFDVVLHLRDDA